MPAIRICSCCEVLNSHLHAILSVWLHQTAYRFTILDCAGHRCMLRLSGVRTAETRVLAFIGSSHCIKALTAQHCQRHPMPNCCSQL